MPVMIDVDTSPPVAATVPAIKRAMRLMKYRYGVDQRDLARYLRIHETDLSAIMNGRHLPTIEEADAIARALGESRQTLFPTL